MLNPDFCKMILKCSVDCVSGSTVLESGLGTVKSKIIGDVQNCVVQNNFNEENAALRKAIEDADYECGVGLLRLNQLDLVTVVASPATVRRSATVPSPGATHLAIWTSSMRLPLLCRS